MPGQGGAGPGGSFLEERCHLKDAADRAGRAAAGIGPVAPPPPTGSISGSRPQPAAHGTGLTKGSGRSRAGSHPGRSRRHTARLCRRARCRGSFLLLWGHCVPRGGPEKAESASSPLHLYPISSHPCAFGIVFLRDARRRAYLSLPKSIIFTLVGDETK